MDTSSAIVAVQYHSGKVARRGTQWLSNLPGCYRENLPTFKYRFEQFVLQVSHWFGTVGFFAMIGAWALAYKGIDLRWAASSAFMAADVGICAAWLAGILARRAGRPTQEHVGVFIFNLIILTLAIHLMFIDRLPALRAWAETFFTPS